MKLLKLRRPVGIFVKSPVNMSAYDGCHFRPSLLGFGKSSLSLSLQETWGSLNLVTKNPALHKAVRS